MTDLITRKSLSHSIVLLGTVSGVALLALGAGLALGSSSAWADGGKGVSTTSSAGGAGGIDGPLASATGKEGEHSPSSTFTSSGSGGGGATDTSTGSGAAGGARGTYGTGPVVLGIAGATGTSGQIISVPDTISTTITGGAGGVGEANVANVHTEGGGGGGGVGVSAIADVTVETSGSVTGGAGSGSSGVGSGGGGAGLFATANVTATSGGKITGGKGGDTAGGGGGQGGAAVLSAGNGIVQNSGVLLGGIGGKSTLGGGGDGGAGIQLLSGGTIINSTGGSITGGTGGSGRYNLLNSTSGGEGGAGIKGENVSIINAGSISGGTGGANSGGPAAVAAAAVFFTGGVNSLELQAGSTITGNVMAFSAEDTLKLGGDTAAGFNVALIGNAAQYRGFGRFEKTGDSVWTLTNTTTALTPWTLTEGTLSIAADGSLGDAAGAITFNGGTLQTTGNFTMSRDVTLNADGIFSTDAATTLNMAGIVSGASGLTKQGDGMLDLTGVNSYSGRTTISDGVLALSGTGSIEASSGVTDEATFDISATTAGASIKTLSGSGVVELGAQTLTLTNAADSFDGVIQGTGGFTLAGGSETLTGDSSAFTGAAEVQSGLLSVNGTLGGTMDVVGGRLQGTGTVGSTTNEAGGTIAPGNSIGTLTINGNYTGNGGTLETEAVLGDDSSATDLLAITGNASGNTNVKVINLGGVGAPTVQGIKIVDVGGVSNGNFDLKGDYVINGQQAMVAGAYGYTLQKNGVSTPDDGDWYLRSSLTAPVTPPTNPGDPTTPPTDPDGPPSTPLYQPGVPVYEAYAQVLLGLNDVSTLQQRVGNRYWTGAGNSRLAQGDGPGTLEAEPAPSDGGSIAVDGRGFWGRIEGAHGRFEPKTSTSSTDYDLDTFKLETGIDGQFYESDAGKLIGGLSAHYRHGSADISSTSGEGSIDTDGYGLGGALTWYGQNGVYVDGQAQATWYTSDLTSDTAGRRLSDGNDGFGYAFSLETGKRMVLDQNWTLTPQAQLAYSNVDFDGFTDPFDARVSLGSGDSLKGRLGLAANYENAWEDGSGKTARSNLYGIANLYYEFLDGTDTDVAGVNFASENDRTWGGIGAGGSYNWNDDKYSLYGEASINTSLASFGDSYSLNGTAGFRVKF